jgi:exopolyphosphatase/guanosine-5'-triphosphate,3'-diphosphate pyrophosphatase
MGRLATLDLGTNTFRLLIADRRQYHPLKRHIIERRITRMGREVSVTGNLSETALREGRKVLGEFAEILRRENVTRVAAVATGVFREALNAQEAIGALSVSLSHPIRVISGEQEGAYTLAGVRKGLGLAEKHEALVIDIGAGSTEFVRSGGRRGGRIESLPVGALYLKESFGKGDPQDPGRFEQMNRTLEDMLDRQGPAFDVKGPIYAIGTGGSITTMACMVQGLRTYDAEKVHRSLLTDVQVREVLEASLPCTVEALRRRYALERGKADLILFGGAFLLQILRRLPEHRMTVSDYGLLEGVALEMG